MYAERFDRLIDFETRKPVDTELWDSPRVVGPFPYEDLNFFGVVSDQEKSNNGTTSGDTVVGR